MVIEEKIGKPQIKKMETEAKCPKCSTILEEDDCYDTSFHSDLVVRYITGGCPKCGIAYQWKEYYDYTGAEEITEC